ncbi:MAG TPA: hypothetical protein VFW07_10850 [Parafilimonas sp.]|nr:hypothetical protein [Parafilimonas sp.]
MKTFKAFIVAAGLLLFLQVSCKKEDGSPAPNVDWSFLLEDSKGLSNQLRISSAYWVFGNPYNLHGNEVNYHLTEAHGHPDHISDIEATDVKWILDVETYLLDYTNHQLYTDIDQRIDHLANQVAGKESNISMFYIADEPYLNGKQITRAMLETAIGKLKAKIPNIPTYITFAHNYFSTEENDKAGTQPGSNRGIPSNLDYVSFDWYSNGTDGSSKRNIDELVIPTLKKLKEMNSTIHILLTAEAYNGTLSDEQLPEAICRYWDLACTDGQVVGIDHFTWADNPNFQGLTSLPKSQSIVKALSKEIRLKRADVPTDNKIPVYEYLDAHDNANNRYEYRYDTWFWQGWTKTTYLVNDVKFYIRPAGEANSKSLYLCYVDKTDEVNRGYMFIDHRLSTEPELSGEKLAKTSKLLGSIYTTQQPGTLPLYEFISETKGNDHAYALNPEEYNGKNGYKLSNGIQPLGYVYPSR